LILNRKFIFIILLHILIITQSCDNGWSHDIPGCKNRSAVNYDPSATIDNGSCYFEQEIIIHDIDATEYYDWVYFSFELGEVVLTGCGEISNEEDCLTFEECLWVLHTTSEEDDYHCHYDDAAAEISMDWDIAFYRHNIKTNGGDSGLLGNVCAVVDDSQLWTNDSFVSTIIFPDDLECQTDELIVGNIFAQQGCYNPIEHFHDCIKNPALDRWGNFNATHNLIPTNFQFFIKDINGGNVKIWLKSYTDINNEPGHISMTYLPF